MCGAFSGRAPSESQTPACGGVGTRNINFPVNFIVPFNVPTDVTENMHLMKFGLKLSLWLRSDRRELLIDTLFPRPPTQGPAGFGGDVARPLSPLKFSEPT
jgi:hypothetical protein